MGFSTAGYKEDANVDWITKPCTCHFVIDEVDGDFAGAADRPRYELELRVVACTEPDQVGKFIHKSRGGEFSIEPEHIKRFFKLACATGVLNHDYLQKQVEAGADVDFDPQEMVGRSFVAPVSFRPGKTNPEKLFVSLGGDYKNVFYAVGDEECDGLPKDEHTLSYARQQGTGLLPTRTSGWRKPGTKAASAGNGKPANGATKNSLPAGQPNRNQTQRQPQQQRQTVPPTDCDDIPF